jgi:aspartyl aminopeptidase
MAHAGNLLYIYLKYTQITGKFNKIKKSEKHQENHKPQIHKGPVIKVNANQRYATNGSTSFLLKQLAKNNKIPTQDFCIRQDSECGR